VTTDNSRSRTGLWNCNHVLSERVNILRVPLWNSGLKKSYCTQTTQWYKLSCTYMISSVTLQFAGTQW